MKRLLLLLLVSNTALADCVTNSILLSAPNIDIHKKTTLRSQHFYNIANRTQKTQHYDVCTALTAMTFNGKTIYKNGYCKSITLKPQESTYQMMLDNSTDVTFHNEGYIGSAVETEIHGECHHLSIVKFKLWVE
jgi:hypothetical protein